MDDLEDIQADLGEGRMTVFTQTANHWPLDHLTSRFLNFGRPIFENLMLSRRRPRPRWKKLITRCLDPILIDIIYRAGKYYSKDYCAKSSGTLPSLCQPAHGSARNSPGKR